MSSKRFTVNPFGDFKLASKDRSRLLEITDALVQLKVEEYESYIKTKKSVDPVYWKRFVSDGPVTTFTERKAFQSAGNMLSTLMVGPLVGTLDEVMFGLVSPTLESMRIKASYLHDFSAAAVLATIIEPTLEKPFRSVVVKWAEFDIPGASIGLVRNRDYVYVESTGILHYPNGERIGYHLVHSVNFPQTFERQGRIRGNMSLCGIFRQEGLDRTDCRGTSVINPKGDIVPSMALARLVHATMAGVNVHHVPQVNQELKASRFEQDVQTVLWSTVPIVQSDEKLSFISPDLELTQSKLSFCVKCLHEANHLDTLEAARYQFVYGHPAYQSAYGSVGTSFMSSLSGSIVATTPLSLRDYSFGEPEI
ncbi:hypothetical protein CCR75_008081 [Bremia lactucae]|uniref:START domain-containing protein n=1 Tax=Bremia lactucae TaxID=4779 RepID=A0A976ILG0_BRELC|nr:hypothetical protein CCR75_008081 [Bremia lactucae]